MQVAMHTVCSVRYRYSRYGYGYRTELNEVYGTVIDIVPSLPKSGTGIDVVPNLPKYPVPV